jgi:preprotein translocase subunit SecY
MWPGWLIFMWILCGLGGVIFWFLVVTIAVTYVEDRRRGAPVADDRRAAPTPAGHHDRLPLP